MKKNKTKRFGSDYIVYRASQICQGFPIKVRLDFAKNFQTYNKNMVLQFVSMLLLQTLHAPLRII